MKFKFYFKNGLVMERAINTDELSEEQSEELANIILLIKYGFKENKDFEISIKGLIIKGSELICCEIEEIE